MEFRREEILPGVFLTALRTDKFKTASLSLSLLTQLDAETASAARTSTALPPIWTGCTACAWSPLSAA